MMQNVHMKSNPGWPWQKWHSTRKKTKKLFINKLNINVRKKTLKCYIWNTDLYGAETCDTSENCSETTW